MTNPSSPIEELFAAPLTVEYLSRPSLKRLLQKEPDLLPSAQALLSNPTWSGAKDSLISYLVSSTATAFNTQDLLWVRLLEAFSTLGAIPDSVFDTIHSTMKGSPLDSSPFAILARVRSTPWFLEYLKMLAALPEDNSASYSLNAYLPHLAHAFFPQDYTRIVTLIARAHDATQAPASSYTSLSQSIWGTCHADHLYSHDKFSLKALGSTKSQDSLIREILMHPDHDPAWLLWDLEQPETNQWVLSFLENTSTHWPLVFKMIPPDLLTPPLSSIPTPLLAKILAGASPALCASMMPIIAARPGRRPF